MASNRAAAVFLPAARLRVGGLMRTQPAADVRSLNVLQRLKFVV